MKKLLTYIAFILFGIYSAQVTIEKTAAVGSETVPAPANSSVSLELGNATGGVKGIVLPWVTDAAAMTATSVAGTLVFDSSDQKIKFGKAASAGATAIQSWVDLSSGAAVPATYNVADSNIEGGSAKVLIGGNPDTDTTIGILVLADTDKAMILPRVNSYTDIVSPSAGMMVYVTSNNQLAVYNGKEWTFWKP